MTLGGFPLRNLIVLLLIAVFFSLNMTACTLFKSSIDNQNGFTNFLEQTEASIRNTEWANAKTGVENSVRVWKKIKPWLQLDIDHDYIEDIENNFSKLEAYIDTESKSDSLSTILLIMTTWKNIGIY